MKRKAKVTIIAFVILALIIGAAVFLAQRRAESAPEAVPVMREPVESVTFLTDIQYQITEGDNCYLDVAFQDDGKEKPLLIFVHGGSWVGGDKEEMSACLHTFSALGYTAASVNYDLLNVTGALQGNCFSIMDEEACIAAAVDYLAQNAEKYQIDTEKVVLIGHSAGGQLVGHLSEQISDHPEDVDFHLSGVVLMSVPSDFRYYLYNNIPIGDLEYSLVDVSFIFDGVYGTDVIAEINKADILYNITENLPPVMLLHGSDDVSVPVSLSQNLYEALEAKGVAAELTILPGAGHDILNNETVFNEINRFLDQYIMENKEE